MNTVFITEISAILDIFELTKVLLITVAPVIGGDNPPTNKIKRGLLFEILLTRFIVFSD